MNKKKYILKAFTLMVISLLLKNQVISQTHIDTDTITTRFRSYVLSGSLSADTTITNYLNNQKPDGSWPDINYADRSLVNWLPLTHLNRVLAICLSYNNKKSIYYHSGFTKTQIYSALNFWNIQNPTSSNWYENDIAGPTVYGKSLLAMKTGDSFGFSIDTLYSLADAGLNYYNVSAAIYVPQANEAVVGSNQTLNLEISMFKACIMDSTDELRRNFDTAFASVKVFTGTNIGMKSDNSYYMHGAQLYNWGYGSEFLGGVAFFAYYARNTAYGTTIGNVKTLIDFVIDGQQWFQQKSIADFNAVGRGLTRSGGLSVSGFRSNCLNYLINMNTSYRTTELNNYYKYDNGGNVTFQSPGNKQFFKSDFMSHHGVNFYLSVKTPSKRTIATESINGENLKAKYMPWGSTNIMTTGTEYQNTIPVWDWTRVPGTTSANDPSANYTKIPGSKYSPTNTFAGGVSNGVYGLSADAFTWDSVSGRKAYFFTPDGMYCMGSNIASNKKNRNIITSVNQCLSSGTITIDSAGIQTTFSGKQSVYTNISWAHQNNIGYLFPNLGKITVANQLQTGSWNSINSAQSTTAVSNTIFSLWFNHDTLPKAGSYEYIVAPYKSVSQFSSWAAACPLKKIVNTASVQALLDDSAKVYAVSFYAAGSILLDTVSKFSVSTNNPILLLIQKQSKGYGISVADPTQLLSSVVITASIPLSGTNATLSADSTILNIVLPKGDTAGKTVTNNYILTNPLPIQFTNINANQQKDGLISIHWEVKDEAGILRYEVEKSVDGKHFSLLQLVTPSDDAKGSYSIENHVISDRNYYRIIAIDANGKMTSSAVTQVATVDLYTAQFRLFPNPIQGNALNLSLENINVGKYVVLIYNSIGQKVSEKVVAYSGGSSTYSLPINEIYSKGAYKVVIREEGSKQVVYQTTLINE